MPSNEQKKWNFTTEFIEIIAGLVIGMISLLGYQLLVIADFLGM